MPRTVKMFALALAAWLPASARALDLVEHPLNPAVPQDAETLEIVGQQLPEAFQRYPVVAMRRHTTVTIEDWAVVPEGKGGGGRDAWTRDWHAVDLIQHAAGTEHANFAFGYPGGFGQVLIDERRRIRGDSYLRTTVHEISDGVVSGTARADAYWFTRQKKITLKDVEPGDFTELKVRSQSEKKMGHAGFGERYFFGELPALEERVCYRHSDKVGLRWHLVDPDGRVEVTEGSVEHDGNTLNQTCFEARQLHPEVREQGAPRWASRAPMLLVSTWEDWGAYGRWLGDKYKGRLKPDQAIRDKVAEITEGLEGEAAIQAIFHWVEQNIRYVQVYFETDSGFVPAEAEEVFERRYGDCKEQTTILIAMLEVIGVKALPALVGTTHVPQPVLDFPMMYQFNHMITYLPEQDRFLDTVGDDAPYPYLLPMDQDRNALVLDGRELVPHRVPWMPAEAATSKKLRRISLVFGEPGGALQYRYDTVLETTGQLSARWHHKRRLGPEQLDEYMAQRWIDEGILESYGFDHPLDDLTRPVVLRFVHRIAAQDVSYAGAERPSHIMLPRLLGIPEATTFWSNTARSYPFAWFDHPQILEERHEVSLPPGYQLVFLPEDLRYRHPEGWFDYQASFERSVEGLLVVTERLVIERGTISADDFLALRDTIGSLHTRVGDRLLLVAVEQEATKEP